MEANGKCNFLFFNFNEDCWLVSLLMIDNLIGLLSISILSSSGWFLVKSKNILELFVCEYWELGLVLVLSLTITQILLISAQSPLISSRCAAYCSLCTAATVLLLTEKCRTSGDFKLFSLIKNCPVSSYFWLLSRSLSIVSCVQMLFVSL